MASNVCKSLLFFMLLRLETHPSPAISTGATVLTPVLNYGTGIHELRHACIHARRQDMRFFDSRTYCHYIN